MKLKNFFKRDILICREITKYTKNIRTSVKDYRYNFSRKGEITVIISEIKEENLSFKELRIR